MSRRDTPYLPKTDDMSQTVLLVLPFSREQPELQSRFLKTRLFMLAVIAQLCFGRLDGVRHGKSARHVQSFMHPYRRSLISARLAKSTPEQ